MPLGKDSCSIAHSTPEVEHYGQLQRVSVSRGHPKPSSQAYAYSLDARPGGRLSLLRNYPVPAPQPLPPLAKTLPRGCREGLNEDGVQQRLPDGCAHQLVLLPQVDLLVLQEVLLLREALVALAAAVGPLPGVDALVADQVRGVAEALAAVQACEGAAAPARVQPLVRDQPLLLREALWAPAALVGPLPPVALLVRPEGGLEVEGLHALGAAVGLVPSRASRESLQVVVLLEGLLARHGGEGSSAGVDALVQRELLLESEALLALGGGVVLLVDQQALLKPEAFPALGAHKEFIARAVTLAPRGGTAAAAKASLTWHSLIHLAPRVPPLVDQSAVAAPNGRGTVEKGFFGALQSQGFTQRSLCLQDFRLEDQPIIWGVKEKTFGARSPGAETARPTQAPCPPVWVAAERMGGPTLRPPARHGSALQARPSPHHGTHRA